jgi:hypothetical protein
MEPDPALRGGESVSFRALGTSTAPQIRNLARVRVEPVDPSRLEVGDIVVATVVLGICTEIAGRAVTAAPPKVVVRERKPSVHGDVHDRGARRR